MFDYESAAIIVPERLGDTLFHTPSIRFLRKMRPAMRIEIIALSELSASVFENNPYVDAVHIAPGRDVLQQIAARCQVVLNIHNHAASRECVKALGLPCVTATFSPHVEHAAAHSQEFFQNLLDEKIPDDEKRYTLFPAPANYAKIEKFLRAQLADPAGDLLIGCHIGCHSIAKKGWKFWTTPTHPKAWPIDNFIALAALLRNTDLRFRLVLTGSTGEIRLGRKLEAREPSAINLIGKTSVVDFAALMDSLRLFIAPDTGTLHAACATDVGLIALFGPTSPRVTGPFPLRPQHCIIHSGKNMEAITPEMVHAAILNHPNIQQALARPSQAASL